MRNEHVETFVKPLFTGWTIHLLHLALNYIDELWVFRWGLIVLSLLQICICYDRDFVLSFSDEYQADILLML